MEQVGHHAHGVPAAAGAGAAGADRRDDDGER